MAITSRDGLLAATKQRVPLQRTATRTSVAAQWFSVFDLAGNPGAGTLAGSNTANGIIPVAGNNGYPPLNAFGVGATGYLSKVDFGSTVACRIALYDRLWVGGAYAFNAAQAVSSPSWASRCTFDGVVDYKGTEIWVEQVTVATGNQAVNVSYLDHGGAAGSTGAVGIAAAPTVGRCWQLPFAPGDCGVSAITNVAGSVASAGTFNVMVLRPLWEARIKVANDGDIHDYLKTGMPEVFQDSALYKLIAADSTSTGVPELSLQIANG